MSGNRHTKSRKPSDADIGSDPGIGTSKGTFKEGDELERGENTIEGDVENDTTAAGGIDPRQKLRTNK
ncbi:MULTISPECIES: hypothetical protein [unclassified Mesorhizobium]|uniref:hypothetical protein n=1 Tax=unclassified Mesorhizobium TaxID=325217 RepID=UPI000BB0A01B|nr:MULTISPECIES: hypothetical protein [unclassified Mesorhizobium]TGT58608.1 hypothetical protein EN813_031645 [Mesorhizobium sp. M00.F.Ca.ET.170.01.1.1]AZO12074.1 hypothetical protein EJ074_25400 [Mesorhizobium sp. M3A.F.Ca.ET.080.04.2.1]PBB84366.1 hypothetical protein CK216_23595 [Mesorhizobium sp. WSM3876]RWB74792.1 MAG: hypothetical protein EOQ49_05255 [Mesorhizobium sp.]RWB89750.1 MAG: hypothetical protein EOQ52_11630 [Mesorhizobium sp.]